MFPRMANLDAESALPASKRDIRLFLAVIMVGNVVATLLCGALMITGHGDAMPTTMEKMTVSRMRMADLESSATGYVYNSQRGHPGSYVQYTNHGTGRYYDSPAPVRYVTYRQPGVILDSEPSVIASVPSYKGKVAPLPAGYVVPLLEAPKRPALAPYYVPGDEVHQDLYRVEVQEDEVSGENDGGESDGSDDDEGDGEEHGGGEDFNNEEQSSSGESGEEAYRNHHEVDNGEKGDHHKDRDEGHYSDEGGNEKSYIDNSGHYGHHDEAEKGNEGESYGQEAYHKKGHKTTGFHNVYRKDEYNKDTDFYDDDHKSGHYDKHSSHDDHHGSADGDYKKGGQRDSGYEEREEGKTGQYDKGHERSQHKGYKSEKGADSYHKNHADYAEKKSAEGNNKYGYNNGHL